MLQIKNLKKKFRDKMLFNDCSLSLNKGERVALVGPNGAGKTTLFRIIMGDEPSDSGEMIIQKDTNIGFLPQEVDAIRGATVIDEVMRCSKEIKNLHKKMEQAVAILSGSTDHDQEQVLNDYGHMQSRFEQLGGYEQEHNAKRVLAGLGFREEDLTRQTDEFSGGWMMRIALAKLLLDTPPLMILDEPTNHLDLKALLWFQDYLLSYEGTLIFTSHDREFIDHVSTRIVDIDEGSLVTYKGTYDSYIEEKNNKRERLIALANEQEREIQKAQLFINRFRATASRAASVQSKIRAIDKMERVVVTREQKTLHFNFPQPQRSGHAVMTLRDIHKSYGDKKVYEGIDLDICKGDKLVLIGSNGAGKSTLLKILSGVLDIDKGTRKLGHNVSIGYYPQHRLDVLNFEKSCLENMQETCTRSETDIRKLLGKFLFPGDMVYNEVSVLSGGEKSRLVMAKILANPPNFLLMDEPTNHLDIPSRNIMIEALTAYSGTLCFISHDVHFIKKIANMVIEVEDGTLQLYPGNYEYYMYKKSLDAKGSHLSASGDFNPSASGKGADPSASGNLNRHSSGRSHTSTRSNNDADAQKRRYSKKIEEAEKQLDRLSVRYEELNRILSDPAVYKKKDFLSITEEHKLLEEQKNILTVEWENCVEELANLKTD